MDLDRLYLDYNATSPLSTSVKAWLKSGDVIFANPASQHSVGKAARKSINESRAKIYSIFGKNEKDTRLIFHSGATEAAFTVTHSLAEEARLNGKRLLVCHSVIDHSAVTSLRGRFWGEHVSFTELRLKSDLSYDHEANFAQLQRKKDEDPGLVILYHHLWVHNETGLVSPLEELLPFKGIADLYLHVDAVQAPGKVENWKSLPVGDMWSFSCHKFGALKGVGFSFIQEGTPLHPLLTGGGQQQGWRGGTENLQGIKSSALALEDLEAVDVARVLRLKGELKKFMEEKLEGLGGVLSSEQMNSNTVYFYLNHLSSDVALALFDLNGLMISAGSACSSGAARPSVVLAQAGLGSIAKNGLRLSVGFDFNEELLNKIQERLLLVFKRLRS